MTVEFVAVVPLLVLVTILCVQAFAVVSAMDATQKAARDAARAQADGRDGAAAAAAALPGWVSVRSIAVPAGGACHGVCSSVTVSIPFGYPGIASVDLLQVTRTADMPET
jgi:hypothetical protein